MKKVKDWESHIIRHFWYCASACRKESETSDEEALKVMKVLFLSQYLYHNSLVYLNTRNTIHAGPFVAFYWIK